MGIRSYLSRLSRSSGYWTLLMGPPLYLHSYSPALFLGPSLVFCISFIYYSYYSNMPSGGDHALSQQLLKFVG